MFSGIWFFHKITWLKKSVYQKLLYLLIIGENSIPDSKPNTKKTSMPWRIKTMAHNYVQMIKMDILMK